MGKKKKVSGGGTTAGTLDIPVKKKAGKKKKAKTPPAKQVRIEGTFDPVPEELQEKVDQYVGTLRSRMETQQEEDVLRREVIQMMHKHNVEKVPLDDDEKDLVLDHGDEKVKIKKRKKPKAVSSLDADYGALDED